MPVKLRFCNLEGDLLQVVLQRSWCRDPLKEILLKRSWRRDLHKWSYKIIMQRSWKRDLAQEILVQRSCTSSLTGSWCRDRDTETLIYRDLAQVVIQDPDAEILTQRSYTRDPHREILHKWSYRILLRRSWRKHLAQEMHCNYLDDVQKWDKNGPKRKVQNEGHLLPTKLVTWPPNKKNKQPCLLSAIEDQRWRLPPPLPSISPSRFKPWGNPSALWRRSAFGFLGLPPPVRPAMLPCVRCGGSKTDGCKLFGRRKLWATKSQPLSEVPPNMNTSSIQMTNTSSSFRQRGHENKCWTTWICAALVARYVSRSLLEEEVRLGSFGAPVCGAEGYYAQITYL